MEDGHSQRAGGGDASVYYTLHVTQVDPEVLLPIQPIRNSNHRTAEDSQENDNSFASSERQSEGSARDQSATRLPPGTYPPSHLLFHLVVLFHHSVEEL